MKAHEETWNADACCGFVKDVAGNIVADVSLLTTEQRMAETTRLLSSAPHMARALLEQGYATDELGWHTREACQGVHNALKKAGVFP